MRHGAATVRVATIALAIAAAVPFTSTCVRAADNEDVINAGASVNRPFSDFLSAQGSTNIFIPPLPDFIAWANNNPQTLFASVDYLGLVAGYLATHGGPALGTQVDGSVSERALADGRAEVTVIVHTRDALTWVVPLPASDLATDPLVFGYRGTDLLADPSLVPALSSSNSKVVFKNTAPGAPLPDLVVAFILGAAGPGQELMSLKFDSNGTGLMRAASGEPEGSPGRCTVTQTGLLTTGFHGAVADGFPAERVTVRPVGGGSVGPHAVGIASSTPNPAEVDRSTAVPHSTWGAIKRLYR